MKYISYFIIVVLLISCHRQLFETYEKKRSVVQSGYQNNPILLESYVLCSVNSDKINDEITYGNLNEDSLFSVFSGSLKQLSLPITISENSVNKCDSSLYENWFFRLRDIDEQVVLNLASSDSRQVHLIPFISRGSIKYRTSHFGSVATIYIDEYIVEYIRIALFMVYQDNIIYSRIWAYRNNIKIHSEEEYEAFTDPTTQEHWDILVGKIMEDYIKRLEK